MMMVFKITFTSTEKDTRVILFKRTLAEANAFVTMYRKAGKGKDFKITPIKLK